jgi:integrase
MPATGDRITKRKDGLFQGMYTAQTPDGPKRKYVYGRKYGEVQRKLAEAMGDAARGIVVDDKNLTVSEYLDRFLEDVQRGSVRGSTYSRDKYLVTNHVKPALGRVKLKNLSAMHLQRLYREKQDAGLSASTVQKVHHVLHKALDQALKWDLIPRNSADAVKAPTPAPKEMHPLSVQEARRLLDTASGDRLEALYVLGVTTGMRRGELLGLKWTDVDLENGRLSIRRALTRTDEGKYVALTEPKTKGSRRTVKLTQRAVQALRSHLERQLVEIEAAGDLYGDDGLVFATEAGTPINPSNLRQRSFTPLLKRSSLPHIRFHDLRHTCATLLLSKGVHPKFVQELLGHATIAITLDTYSHVMPGMGNQTARAMESTLEEDQPEEKSTAGGASEETDTTQRS